MQQPHKLTLTAQQFATLEHRLTNLIVTSAEKERESLVANDKTTAAYYEGKAFAYKFALTLLQEQATQ